PAPQSSICCQPEFVMIFRAGVISVRGTSRVALPVKILLNCTVSSNDPFMPGYWFAPAAAPLCNQFPPPPLDHFAFVPNVPFQTHVPAGHSRDSSASTVGRKEGRELQQHEVCFALEIRVEARRRRVDRNMVDLLGEG